MVNLDTKKIVLRDGWLPKSRWWLDHGQFQPDQQPIQLTLEQAEEEEEEEKEEHYVGPRKERPKYYGLAPYDPKLDLKEGQYLIVTDEEIYPIW